MPGTNSGLGQIRKLMDLKVEKQAKIDDLERQAEALRREMAGIDASIAAIDDDQVNLKLKAISEGQNQRDRLRRFAEVNGGLVGITEAGRLMVEFGVTTTSLKNLRPTLYSIVNNSPDEWEKASPGIYRYIGGDQG